MWFDDKINKKFAFYAVLLILAMAAIVYHSENRKEIQTFSSDKSDNWRDAKRVMYDVIYKNHAFTLYEGCRYRSGKIDYGACSYTPKQDRYKDRAMIVEAEHIVPASLLPARQYGCWMKGRGECEKNDAKAQAMIFDLHNLAPSIGQVNLYRGNKRYGESKETFEPVDCIKGDVARIWLYMNLRYDVALESGEKEMFERWSKLDPVSPWEIMREKRIAKYTFVNNPYVKGQTPDLSGACPWE